MADLDSPEAKSIEVAVSDALLRLSLIFFILSINNKAVGVLCGWRKESY